jgi:predicted helicase
MIQLPGIKDKSVWNLATAKRSILEDIGEFDGDINKALEVRLKEILYRPFDVRWTYYLPKSGKFIGRPRYDVLKHFVLGENVGLIAIRQIVLSDCSVGEYNPIFVSKTIVDRRFFLSNRSACAIFPLYRYEEDKETKKLKKVPNIKPEILKLLKEKYNATPEDFLYYAYAVLHDPKYRERYAEFLKIDFPRIPLYDKETFDKYKQIGKELVELHLMRKDIPIDLAGKIKGESLKVEKVKYDAKLKGVRINDKTILLGIPEVVWNYKIGGYQVIEKYLKGRKGRELSLDELEHMYRVVEIIKRTIKLVKVLEGINPKYHIKLIFHTS